MKIQIKQPTHRGFTLVELLVVIVIIAVLSALGFAVGTGALQKARMVTAQSSATNVANAVEAFYSEYHLLPDPTGASADNSSSPYETVDDSNGTDLLDILAGFEDDTDDMQNDRKVKFLSVKEAENPKKGGIVYNSTGDKVVGIYDSWGQPFFLVLDYDYDGRLVFTPSSKYTYDAKLNNKRVAVYSLGTNSPDDAKRKDLVKTW
jgi:prepilin-type N-terminal cleavage/methylation domain-containing protein